MITINRDTSQQIICFSGKGRTWLKFSACVRQNLREEFIFSRQGSISVPESAISAILRCIRESGINESEFSGIISDFRLQEKARQNAMNIITAKDDSKIPDRWNMLKSYQKVAVNAMVQKNLRGICLFDEQGTGKTIMALAAFDILKERGDIDQMLVIAPKSVLNSWRNDVEKMPTEQRVSIAEGTRTQKYQSINAQVDITALSYDTLNTMPHLVKVKAQRGKCLLTVDEAFSIKNPQTLKAGAIRELRKECTRAFILSGTPAPRTPEDVIHQFDIVDNGYAFHGYRSTGDITRDTIEIFNVISTRSAFIRRMKEDVLSLPPKDIRIVNVTLSERQEELYVQAREKLELHLRGMDNKMFKKNLANYFQRRAKLLQLCGCPSMVDNLIPDLHAKLEKLDELVEDIVVNGGRKVVIWTCYTRSIAEIKARYQQHGLVTITGNSSDEERRDAINRFQNDPNVNIFVGNPAAAGAGITLHSASDSIYVSYSDKAADFIQSIDRTHRIGQNAPVVRYHFLVCNGTIEINQVRLLHEKILRQHNIFGENVEWPKSVEDALKELESE